MSWLLWWTVMYIPRRIDRFRLLKGAGVSLREDYKDPLERLLDYMELVRCYEREKLFIFVNLRSYFPDDSISRFLQTALDHQYWLLLVDACEHPKLPEEQRLIIDKHLCEIENRSR